MFQEEVLVLVEEDRGLEEEVFGLQGRGLSVRGGGRVAQGRGLGIEEVVWVLKEENFGLEEELWVLEEEVLGLKD